MSSQPAILGGTPLASPMLPFVRPFLPSLEQMKPQMQTALRYGMVTTGPYAEQLGEEVAATLGVPYAVPVSSCTTGLILATQALDLPEGAEVIVPSFTFMATALGPVWNRLRLRFGDVDRTTFNLDPQAVEAAITPQTAAIAGVHLYGNPAPVEALEALAARHGIALFFDAAHGFGALHQQKPLGAGGQFEAFSMSPTKLLIASEGGIVTTRDEHIAEHIRYARNYGNPGDYDCRYPGMNARLSEWHAICALHSLSHLETAARHRNHVVAYYRERLGRLAGIQFQHVAAEDRCSYKDFTLLIDEKTFGLSRDRIKQALLAEGIQTKIYFSPVLHRTTAFKSFAPSDVGNYLPNTLYLEAHVLSLPLYSDMTESEAELVCVAMEQIHEHAHAIESV